MTTSVQTKFDVGGVMLDRPFKVRRLGHFGFNTRNLEDARRFYIDLLGFKISDEADILMRILTPEQRAAIPEGPGWFTRYGGDHHAFVLFNRKVMDALSGGHGRPDMTINQITWQVGSLREVGDAAKWFNDTGVPIQRTGRDMPGSNWHTYIYDPDGHTNELYYGIEQVGWDGLSKPREMYYRGFREPPQLPQINEFDEVQDALSKGIDVHAGYRHIDTLPAKYEVDGVMLARPFKITRIGPVSLYVDDLDKAEAFYRDVMGFDVTETTQLKGERIVHLRTNTEHHAMTLIPASLKGSVDMGTNTTCAAFGLQLANYRQLRDAVDFLRGNGIRVETHVPDELHPGMDYVAHAFDKDGHCIQLYYSMEQIGWDGKPRPRSERRYGNAHDWPETLDQISDSYNGEPYLGPWG
ncbi:MAG TPA: VOC family protein [Dehalococcoidia bacterium]|nr:VOC family protein [Dehalococcoidia bacterium]